MDLKVSFCCVFLGENCLWGYCNPFGKLGLMLQSEKKLFFVETIILHAKIYLTWKQIYIEDKVHNRQSSVEGLFQAKGGGEHLLFKTSFGKALT